MKPTQDPPRLVDASGESALRDALAGARADLPGADRLAAVAARLPLAGPAPSGGTPRGGAPHAPPLPAMSPATSLLPAMGIGAALAVAVLAVTWIPSSAPPPRASNAVSAPALPTAPIAPAASTELVVPPAPSASCAPALALSAAPSGEPASSASGDEDETETHLLQRAQEALSAEPARALALAGDHAARFPKGSLSQEREVIAIGALVALGRAPEARARADAFLARFPTSAHRGRIEVLVPGLKIDAPDHKSGETTPPTP